MPNMNGVKLANIIREKNKDLPIILLSSAGDEKRKQHAHLISHVLTKPVKQKILSNAINAELRKLGAGQMATKPSEKKLSSTFASKYPLNILIAEDNPVNQTLAIRALHKLGYETKVAANGQLAVEEIIKRHYDVILMDVQMPELDGLEATRIIRQSKEKQPVIIAMTANAMKEDKEACLQAGMDDYISKPIKFEILIEMLEKWALHIVKMK